MSGSEFVMKSRFPHPAAELFAWHERPGAFERLNPPWDPVRVISSDPGVRDGSRVRLRAGLAPFGPLAVFSLHWTLEHSGYIAGRQFRDEQVSGPFARWRHTHLAEPDGPDASWLEDRIEYELPLGPLGRITAGGLVGNKLQQVFTYRHRTTLEDLAAHRAAGGAAMRVLITGATGLVGGWLVKRLIEAEADVVCLVRDWVPRSELNQSGMLDKISVVRGDLCDQDCLERTLGEFQQDASWHWYRR